MDYEKKANNIDSSGFGNYIRDYVYSNQEPCISDRSSVCVGSYNCIIQKGREA